MSDNLKRYLAIKQALRQLWPARAAGTPGVIAERAGDVYQRHCRQPGHAYAAGRQEDTDGRQRG